jgi:putative addiction module component (TIGR02574 family)
MKTDAGALLEAALKLPVEARAAMAATLMESLDDDVDADAEAAWALEIARRLKAHREGRARSLPWSEARRRILSGA